MKLNPDMLLWFSKPEKAINKRLNDNLQEEQQLKDQKLKEKIENIRKSFIAYNDSLMMRVQ